MGFPPMWQLEHHQPPSMGNFPLEEQLCWRPACSPVGGGLGEGPEVFWETSCAFPLTTDLPPGTHLGCLSHWNPLFPPVGLCVVILDYFSCCWSTRVPVFTHLLGGCFYLVISHAALQALCS